MGGTLASSLALSLATTTHQSRASPQIAGILSFALYVPTSSSSSIHARRVERSILLGAKANFAINKSCLARPRALACNVRRLFPTRKRSSLIVGRSFLSFAAGDRF